jgi:aminoethylphosphonate catabolism LysR family transcriptional regulator
LLFVNFNQLRSFFAVAQEMSFTRAARALNIGQPTLTVQVRALEKIYDVELFHRTPRGLELTDTGSALYRVARQIFRLEEEAVEVLSAGRNELSGKLRVGTVGPCFVMKLLAAFNKTYPLVQVSIDSDNSDAVVQRVLDVELDVAVVGSAEDDPRLLTLRLGSHEVIFFVNADHPWADRGAIPLHQMDGQRLIMREFGSVTRRALEDVLDAQRVAPKIVMEVSREAVREAVSEGLGIGIMSEAEFRPELGLRPLRISDHKAYTYSDLVCLRARQDTRQVAAFFECTRKLLQEAEAVLQPARLALPGASAA